LSLSPISKLPSVSTAKCREAGEAVLRGSAWGSCVRSAGNDRHDLPLCRQSADGVVFCIGKVRRISALRNSVRAGGGLPGRQSSPVKPTAHAVTWRMTPL
jgi:hypothetical protein